MIIKEDYGNKINKYGILNFVNISIIFAFFNEQFEMTSF